MMGDFCVGFTYLTFPSHIVSPRYGQEIRHLDIQQLASWAMTRASSSASAMWTLLTSAPGSSH
jgi:hypothetical protein